jgi:hypothetical protein
MKFSPWFWVGVALIGLGVLLQVVSLALQLVAL